MARKKVCHFLVERGRGVNGTSYACPILKAAERGCFDTNGSSDPFDTTCRTCLVSHYWRTAIRAAKRVEPGPAVEELKAIVKHLKEWARKDVDKTNYFYLSGIGYAVQKMQERIRVIERDAPFVRRKRDSL